LELDDSEDSLSLGQVNEDQNDKLNGIPGGANINPGQKSFGTLVNPNAFPTLNVELGATSRISPQHSPRGAYGKKSTTLESYGIGLAPERKEPDTYTGSRASAYNQTDAGSDLNNEHIDQHRRSHQISPLAAIQSFNENAHKESSKSKSVMHAPPEPVLEVDEPEENHGMVGGGGYQEQEGFDNFAPQDYRSPQDPPPGHYENNHEYI